MFEYLALMTLLGAIYIASLIYLKLTRKHQDIYDELKISNWLIITLLLTGFLLGIIYSANKLYDEPQTVRIAMIICFTLAVPLTVIGISSFKVLISSMTTINKK